jgi:hypothetical protein
MSNLQVTGFPNWHHYRVASAQDLPPNLAEETVAMTPDALMLYCSSRVSSLDTQMNTVFLQQQRNNTEQQIVQQAAADLQAFQTNGVGSSGHPDTATCQKLEAELYAAYQQAYHLDPTSPLTLSLAKLHDEVMASGSGPYDDGGVHHGYIGPGPHGYATGHTEEDGIIDSDEIGGYVAETQSISSTINSSSELGMIKLQSLMSQRQTAIQLTTNLIQTLDDTDQKVVGNIGH